MDLEITKDEIVVHGAPMPAGMHQSLQTLLKNYGQLDAMGMDLVMGSFYDSLNKAQLLKFVQS